MRIFVLLLISALFSVNLLVGCARESASNQQGGSAPGKGGGIDGAGGDFLYNTVEEVRKEIDETWKLMLVSRLDNPLVIAYNDFLSNKTKTSEEDKVILGMLEKIHSLKPGGTFDTDMLSQEIKKLDLREYLIQKKLDLREKSYCDGQDHRKGSVTKLDRSGDICISLLALTLTPTASLKADLVGLFAHEIAHLNGFDEPSAQRLQRYVLKHIDHLLRKQGDATKSTFMNDLKNAMDGVLNIIVYDVIDESYLKRLESFSFGTSISIPQPYSGDDLKFGKPETYESAFASVVSLDVEIGTFQSELEEKMQTAKPLKVSPEILAKIRAFGLECIETEQKIIKYALDPSNKDYSFYMENSERRKAFIMKATDPATLTDPKLRPKLQKTPGLFSDFESLY